MMIYSVLCLLISDDSQQPSGLFCTIFVPIGWMSKEQSKAKPQERGCSRSSRTARTERCPPLSDTDDHTIQRDIQGQCVTLCIFTQTTITIYLIIIRSIYTIL